MKGEMNAERGYSADNYRDNSCCRRIFDGWCGILPGIPGLRSVSQWPYSTGFERTIFVCRRVDPDGQKREGPDDEKYPAEQRTFKSGCKRPRTEVDPSLSMKIPLRIRADIIQDFSSIIKRLK